MDKAEFYRRYANTPIEKRTEILDPQSTTELTLQDIYQRLSDLDNMDHPLDEERVELLNQAELYMGKEE